MVPTLFKCSQLQKTFSFGQSFLMTSLCSYQGKISPPDSQQENILWKTMFPSEKHVVFPQDELLVLFKARVYLPASTASNEDIYEINKKNENPIQFYLKEMYMEKYVKILLRKKNKDICFGGKNDLQKKSTHLFRFLQWRGDNVFEDFFCFEIYIQILPELNRTFQYH